MSEKTRPAKSEGLIKTNGSKTDPQVASLESLVDELVKDRPLEEKVRACMLAAGLAYCKDPIEQMNLVLAKLDRIRAKVSVQKRPRDSDKDQ